MCVCTTISKEHMTKKRSISELQLKAEHKPISHMQKWQSKILPKWSDSADAAKEKPRLVFRRDARATLGEEKQASGVKWIPLCM